MGTYPKSNKQRVFSTVGTTRFDAFNDKVLSVNNLVMMRRELNASELSMQTGVYDVDGAIIRLTKEAQQYQSKT